MIAATVEPGDLPGYQRAVLRSRERLRRWNPVDPADLAHHLANQSERHRTFIIRARQIEGDHDIVGRVNVTNIVRGRANAAAMGYDAYDPYAGRGLFVEGLRLIVDLAFAPEPLGLGLHRLEAAVQPGNVRSAGMLRRLGFRRRGAWPSYLWLADEHGDDAWRDHIIYGVVAEEWPSPAYPDQGVKPVLVSLPQATEPGTARRIAVELGLPLYPAERICAAGGDQLLTQLVVDSPRGAVVHGELAGSTWAGLLTAIGQDREQLVSVADPPGESPREVTQLVLAVQAQQSEQTRRPGG